MDLRKELSELLEMTVVSIWRNKPLLIGICVVTVAVGSIAAWQWYGITRQAITGLYASKQPDFEVMIGINRFDQSMCVLIGHNTSYDPHAPLEPGRVYSSEDPVEGLLSSGRITASYPADYENSGLWVDGEKRDLSNGLVVVYFSDKHRATDLMIPEDEQDAFIEDAQNLSKSKFIKKWITPRLPLMGEGKTLPTNDDNG